MINAPEPNLHRSDQIPAVSRIGGVALIGAPLLFLLSEISHPASQVETAMELLSVACHMNQWYVAHILALGAILLLPFAVQGLLDLLGGRYCVLSHIAAGLASVGVTAVSGMLAFDLVTWQMAAGGPNAEMIGLYDRVTGSLGFSLPFLTIGPLALVLGLMLFSFLLFRSNAIARWQSVLLGVGIFLYGFAGPVFPVSNGSLLVTVGAGLMLAGLGPAGIRAISTAGRGTAQ